MPSRRILVLALMVCLSLGFSAPSLPGVFTFEFFIDTVVEAKSRPARLRTGISMPRVIVLAHVADTAQPDVLGATFHPDARGPDRSRVLPSGRSSLAPASLDDH